MIHKQHFTIFSIAAAIILLPCLYDSLDLQPTSSGIDAYHTKPNWIMQSGRLNVRLSHKITYGVNFFYIG